jgi:hypothetical protein
MSPDAAKEKLAGAALTEGTGLKNSGNENTERRSNATAGRMRPVLFVEKAGGRNPALNEELVLDVLRTALKREGIRLDQMRLDSVAFNHCILKVTKATKGYPEIESGNAGFLEGSMILERSSHNHQRFLYELHGTVAAETVSTIPIR